MKNKKSVIMIGVIVFVLLISFNYISGDSITEARKSIMVGNAHGNIYVSGFITVNSEKNEITANITLKNMRHRGQPVRGSRIVLNSSSLREVSPGNYSGVSRSYDLRRSNTTGVLNRKNKNINLKLYTRGGALGGGVPIEIKANLNEGLRLSVKPVHRRGVNLTGPVNISWSSTKHDRNKINFAIINSRGEIVFEKINRSGGGMQLKMPRKMVPPNGIYTFRVIKFKERITDIPNSSAGSYIDLFTEATDKHKTFK